MHDFIERLLSGEVLVADGATGTNLQAAGLKHGGHTEEWLIDRPELVLELARAFVDAGADIILTCSFGATSIRMEGSRYEGKVEELNKRAAAIAKQAASGSSVLVAGSIGPLGKLLQPYGPISAEEARRAYEQQARALVDGGVDLLIIETQYSLEEAQAALDAARAVTQLPVVVSFSYDRGTRTMMGVKPDAAAMLFRKLGASMIGVNCGTNLENGLAVIREYATAAPSFPIWAKLNAGLPRMEGGTAMYDVSPDGMAEFAIGAIQLGARVVGGCCGSTPAHVQAIAKAVIGFRRAASVAGPMGQDPRL